MPQITLRLSKNINLASIDLHALFTAIHNILGTAPSLEIRSCQSGVIQEDFSYIGHDDAGMTKVFLEILWLDSPARVAVKPAIAAQLKTVLTQYLNEPIKNQGLAFHPRIRIANAGTLSEDYFIY